MYKKLSELRFMIGLFFSIVSLILAVNALWRDAGAHINLYTAIVFLIFGLGMMFIKKKFDQKGT